MIVIRLNQALQRLIELIVNLGELLSHLHVDGLLLDYVLLCLPLRCEQFGIELAFDLLFDVFLLSQHLVEIRLI